MLPALIFLMDFNNENGCVNVGTGNCFCFKKLAFSVKEIIGYNREVI